MNVPDAANCWPAPSGIDAVVGVIDRETSAAGETLRVVCPEMPPKVAVMVALPAAREVANPDEDTVATPVAEDDQVAVADRFWVPPSEYVPVAVNCTDWPSGTEGFAGVTAMLIRAGELTDRAALPVIEPDVAVMVVFPVATPRASPAALTAATAGADEVQATELVMFDVLPSESVPVAVNCCDCPTGTDALAGVTAIDLSTGART